MFVIRINKNRKPHEKARVTLSENGILGATFEMRHTGHGRYECNSTAHSGKIFIDGSCYGEHPHNDTIDL